MRNQDERRKRILRAGTHQELWALVLVYLILIGIALMFGRDVGYGIAFGVCIGLGVLVTVSFLSIHLLDRVTAAGLEWVDKYRKQRLHHHPGKGK